MGDYAIRAQFTAACEPAAVVRWLDTVDGIAGWWSDTVGGRASDAGDRFTVSFPDAPMDFELEVREASEAAVEWFVAENPPWWQGTTIRFDIAAGEEGGTSLLFTHSGFEPDHPIIAPITPAWVRFVDNLVAVSESGVANPAVVN